MTPVQRVRSILPSLLLAASMSTLAAGAENPPTVAPGGNLIVDGVPPVPAEIVEKASRYGEARAALFADWHPTRNEMLILTRFADTPQVHLVKGPGGARTQLTFFPDRVEGAKFEPTKGDYFVFHKGTGGAEFYQNYRYDLATGDITLLTDGKGRNSEPTFSHDGKFVAYTSTRRDGTDTDLYVENPLDPKTDHLLAPVQGGGWEVQDWSPDGKKLLVTEEISINESYLWLVDSQTGEKTELTPRPAPDAPKVAYGKARFAAEGLSCYVITDQDSEFRHLAAFDLTTKKARALTPDTAPFDTCDLEDFALSRDGNRIAGVLNDKGVSRVFAFDFSRVPFPVNVSVGPELENTIISGLKWRPDGEALAFTAAGARLPADVFTSSAQEGTYQLLDEGGDGRPPTVGVTLTRWTTSETGGVAPAAFVQPKLVTWKSFDGREISGYLYAPDEEKFPGKRPVIINIHGGPEAQSRPVFLGRNNYLINELGCAVIFPNVRGSSGFGRTFVNLDNGFRREDSYKDIGALLDWVGTQPGLDAGRIMVTGGSYGGHMTLAVSTFFADKIRCSLDVVGMSNLRTFLEHTESYRRDLRRVEYGDERDPKMAEFMDRIAPLNNVAKITKPMFVVAGYNDPRVPRTEAEQIVGALKKQGTPVWFLMARDEGHGFAKKKNADYQFYATVEFIQQYLLGGQ